MIRLLFAFLLLWLQPGIGSAHTGGITGFATITIGAQSVRYSLTLSNIAESPLYEAMHLGRPDVVPDYRPLVPAIGERIRLSGEGGACAVGKGEIVPPSATSISVTANVDFSCPGEIGRLRIRDDMSEVLGNNHHTLALIVWTGGSQQFAFGADARETTVDLTGRIDASRGAGSFFALGIEHILTGYDHLLFLLVLILRGGSLIQLLKIVTAFTLAHTVTLGLAAFDVVTLPGTLVEAVIALSIAYVAAENLFPKYAISRRWTVSFLFGLVHGFGFSSVLREIGLPKDNLLWSLLNFNLGVEAGQAAMVLLLVPILMRIRRRPWEPKLTMTLSAIVLVVGMVLFVERIFFAT